MSNRLLEVMVGIETYQIPQHHGHLLLHVNLETFDNIMECKRTDPCRDGSKMYFNSVNFAQSLILGYIPCVQSLFSPATDVLYSGLEYENLKLARETFITTTFIDRCLGEADDVFKLSEGIINKINSEVARSEWEDRISKKIYCIYQLDSLLKMMRNITLPGHPINFTEMPDLKYMNRHIEKLKKEINEMRKTHKNYLDESFVYRTLHAEYINIYNSKSI